MNWGSSKKTSSNSSQLTISHRFLSIKQKNTLCFNYICIYSKGKIYNSINIVGTTLAKTFEGDINIQENVHREETTAKENEELGHHSVKYDRVGI